MNLKQEALASIAPIHKFFDRSTRCLGEDDSAFRPREGMLRVAEHVAQVAQVIDWFRVGALEDSWDMDFEAAVQAVAKVTSLQEARQYLADACDRLKAALEATSEARLAEMLPDNPILPGRPRYHLIEAIVDHTAHHRGALTVYARLLGKTPDMPYAED